MRVQKMDWGYIEWMEPENAMEGNEASLHVGKVYIDPGKTMLPHVHYEEQFVYVLEGYGTGYINGKPQKFEPGAIFHMPAGCTHEFVNQGESPVIHLMASSPVSIDPDNLIDKARADSVETQHRLYAAIEAVRPQFLKVNMSFVIRGASGQVMIKSSSFPTFCEKTCGILRTNACPCLKQATGGGETSENTFVCPYGWTIFQVPILWEEQLLGYIQGGYIRQSHGRFAGDRGESPAQPQVVEGAASINREAYASVASENGFDTPDSSAFGLLQLLRKVARALRNFCEYDQSRRELLEKEKSLSHSLDTQRLLEDHLRTTEHTVTNLKINNHFLFNTLNSMAAMALESGGMSLYQSIIDLSKMLRYSVRIQNSQVPLRMEMDYLKAYLKLQRLRYPEDLTFTIQMEEEAGDGAVPFNFLQPIVENAFTHGFSGQKEKRLEIRALKKEPQEGEARGRLWVSIRNSGSPVTREQSHAIRMQMQSGNSHGLSMVYEKLRAAYGDAFWTEILPGDKEGMCFTIRMPFVPADEEPDDCGTGNSV